MIPALLVRGGCALLALALVALAPTALAGPADDCSDFRLDDGTPVGGICIDPNTRPQDVVHPCIALILATQEEVLSLTGPPRP